MPKRKIAAEDEILSYMTRVFRGEEEYVKDRYTAGTDLLKWSRGGRADEVVPVIIEGSDRLS